MQLDPEYSSVSGNKAIEQNRTNTLARTMLSKDIYILYTLSTLGIDEIYYYCIP